MIGCMPIKLTDRCVLVTCYLILLAVNLLNLSTNFHQGLILTKSHWPLLVSTHTLKAPRRYPLQSPAVCPVCINHFFLVTIRWQSFLHVRHQQWYDNQNWHMVTSSQCARWGNKISPALLLLIRGGHNCVSSVEDAPRWWLLAANDISFLLPCLTSTILPHTIVLCAGSIYECTFDELNLFPLNCHNHLTA